MKRTRAPFVTILAAALVPALTHAATGEEILQSQCSSCHALSKPEDTSLDRLLNRKGPDLYYAGVKFNKEWLVRWLQEPTRIRPAGVMYRKVVKPGPEGSADVVDESLLPAHMKLSAEDAAAAACGARRRFAARGAGRIQGRRAERDDGVSPLQQAAGVLLVPRRQAG